MTSTGSTAHGNLHTHTAAAQLAKSLKLCCCCCWFIRLRDPGCITYTMSVGQVQVDVQSSTLEAGDKIVLHVNGTTSMRSIPAHGSFRICTCVNAPHATALPIPCVVLTHGAE